MRKGNKGVLRLVRDNDSHTGLSAAILLRGVRAKESKNGVMVLAQSEFIANMLVNCEGFRIRPRVIATVECVLNEKQKKELTRRKALERAYAGGPMLK